LVDGHCHLDRRIGTCIEAMRQLHAEAKAAGIHEMVLLNLPELAFANEQVIKNAQQYEDFFHVFPSINPIDYWSEKKIKALKAAGAAGLKLHPRLHNYHVMDSACVSLLRVAGTLELPVMIDCFPDGKNLQLGNLPEAFARLAQTVPKTRIAIGHAGGHHILDALMVSKYCKNVFLDLSYTLLYYRNSTMVDNIIFTIRSIRADRTFWGSDYPDRPYTETVDMSMQEFKRMNISSETLDQIVTINARKFLGMTG